MLFPARLAWRVLIRVATILVLPVSAMVWLMHLLRYVSDIRRSDVVVLMTNPPAFAHTIVGPDVARRMFKGQQCLFLVAFWKFGFNPLVSEIWSDIDVRFIRRVCSKRDMSTSSMGPHPRPGAPALLIRISMPLNSFNT